MNLNFMISGYGRDAGALVSSRAFASKVEDTAWDHTLSISGLDDQDEQAAPSELSVDCGNGNQSSKRQVIKTKWQARL